MIAKGRPLTKDDYQGLENTLNQLDDSTFEGVRSNLGRTKYLRQRNYEPGNVHAMVLGSQAALGLGIGYNLFGGSDGYKAVFPTEEDPTKTENVLHEIGAKYVLGRTGKMLPWEEFSIVRPDVSREEYNKYKAYKFNKNLKAEDGQFIGPMGIIKTNADGIQGPEVEFLGRSLPLVTGVAPAAIALGGAIGGARLGNRMNPRSGAIRGGLVGSAIGTATGILTGKLLEEKRRRNNLQENLPKGVDVDSFLAQNERMKKDMYKKRQSNPEFRQQKGETKANYGIRSKQQLLQEQMRQQQALVATLVDQERRQRAQKAIEQQMSLQNRVINAGQNGASALQYFEEDPSQGIGQQNLIAPM